MNIAHFLDYDDDIEADDNIEVNVIQGHQNPFYVDHTVDVANTQEQAAGIAQWHTSYH